MRIAGIFLGLMLAAGVSGPVYAQQTAGRTLALDARLAGDTNRTRLVIDLNRKVEVRAYQIANPNRIVIDLPEVTFDLPVGAGKQSRGLIAAYRYGNFAPGKARIVIDLREPANIDKTFVIPAVEDQPARLVIDLVRTDAANFLKQAIIPEKPQPKAQVQQPPADLRPLIVIDPGHGGPDTGAIAKTGDEEKEVVLQVAKQLRAELLKTNRYRVIMTRDDDTFVPLDERVSIARTNAAALFISVHADSLSKGTGEASGATVYTVSERASDKEAQSLADKENRADILAGYNLASQPDDVANILFNLAQRDTMNASAMFARTLVGTLKKSARLHKSPLKSAGFVVLRSPEVPSVLLELGYLSSPADLKQMTSEAWREKVSRSVVEAIDKFFASRTSTLVGR
ncbi:MAG TPA: N-acetylmuramoyl-L-alanine amidase [Xanthobacteraceae bacterium]|nr:N-acetylmuramoyl-L-alanine amidase [Xanthobacteraceae bacterium]